MEISGFNIAKLPDHKQYHLKRWLLNNGYTWHYNKKGQQICDTMLVNLFESRALRLQLLRPNNYWLQ